MRCVWKLKISRIPYQWRESLCGFLFRYHLDFNSHKIFEIFEILRHIIRIYWYQMFLKVTRENDVNLLWNVSVTFNIQHDMILTDIFESEWKPHFLYNLCATISHLIFMSLFVFISLPKILRQCKRIISLDSHNNDPLSYMNLKKGELRFLGIKERRKKKEKFHLNAINHLNCVGEWSIHICETAE